MPVIAIVGAGPGLGYEIARAFGAKGFTVALLARSAEKLDALAAKLEGEGIEAAGFTADITRPETIAAAFTQIKDRFGRIDVLEFSPADATLGAAGVLDVTPENLQPQFDFYLGAIAAVKQVAPDMITAKDGTILITTGGGSIDPVPFLANINVAAAGLRNWTLNLHNELKAHGVYVAHLAITAWIGAGHPDAEPDVIARNYIELYQTRTEPEHHHIALDQ
ncbi:SDR family NAD(P)-dependent oxidoreductase [Glycomyces dulcitolivorans]|uniref:SDR family NAD(P)-dependent oxidoreductase n=1 Tax=Glycomyces dulcitolivorans TaxID=2200759 RepID=UPI000DD323D9|nr:SDR family NAD(P)-dependent oxidoreductase [Glycomyces dulcitolivorans]